MNLKALQLRALLEKKGKRLPTHNLEQFVALIDRILAQGGAIVLTCGACGDRICFYEGSLQRLYARFYTKPCQRCGALNQFTCRVGQGEENEL